MSKKLYVLAKVTYGDFDNERETPLMVSANRQALEMECVKLNSKLTKEELKQEVHYSVMTEQVEYLDV